MDQFAGPSHSVRCAPEIMRTANIACTAPDPVLTLSRELGDEAFDLVLLFVSPQADIENVAARAAELLPDSLVLGCTTAGELTSEGYSDGNIVAVGFPRAYFRARMLLVEDLDAYDPQALIGRMVQSRNALMRDVPDWDYEFNFLMIDGLSRCEDKLTADLALGLGPVPLFGGSAGDGESFETTFVIANGRAMRNAAIVAQIRTICPIKVFKSDHLVPTERRMVVTGADPDRRIVHEINAEPAAREYARVLGKDPEQLDTFTFAAHPVVVRIGEQHHVRSIQRVADNGDLVFFSAIGEGLVLSLAEPMDMVGHLEGEIRNLSANGAPDAILACDCLLRRLEAEQKQLKGKLSDILASNHVVGFSTYGEQLNSMHVNQTLTGVAIYPPEQPPKTA
ncbi:FIST N-terminal domain-containing protein [Thalassovita aquimarina]|uniref:FIST C-terminal domain-containing protein n=1 Tax=Thalassovita aquimarina TaxID=2785917 RepID=A0ABS5HQH3_9RHOB|nr:FIST N-terminal domain-containing protein [Thalassovita aquimarina]MBR9651210.1 FIST C-terminal domain-containing protein [Thalassovita aquimarina]